MPSYKDKARNTWYCKFYYRDWAGNKKQKKKEGFTTQRDAKAFEVSFLDKQAGACDIKFSSLVSLYLDDCKIRLKASTYSTKEFIITLKILPYFKNMKINTIKAAHIREWQNKLLDAKFDRYGKTAIQPKGYSPTYLRVLHSQLSAIFNFAVKYYHLPQNPARLCGSIGKQHADTMQFWTIEEFKTFIAAVKDEPTYYTIFNILFFTGIREGELLALTPNDFNFEDKTLTINKTYARLAGGKEVIQPPKTPKSNRCITVPAFLNDIVKDYIDKTDALPQERLFEITKHGLYKHLKKGCQLSNVKLIRVHDLRHSHASLLIEQGFSPLVIKERLGHEKIETTLQTYSHLYPNKQNEIADKLNNLI